MFLGVRRTIGSSQDVLPPEREDLEHMYNRLNKPLTDEELRCNPNPSVLTVGARAVQKHASRQSKNAHFWIGEDGSFNGMTELEKNLKAEKVLEIIIDQCQWINIHTLHQKSDVFILEIRNAIGFGARWEI